MKISTNLFFDRASLQMQGNQNRLTQVQAELGTGKKINKPSDEADKASTLQRLNTIIEQNESYKRNLSSLTERLENQDTSLRSVSSMLTRLRELSIQYANGTLSADQRKIAAIEVRGIRDQVLSLANLRDSNGLGLFSGSRVVQDAFSAAGVYQGDQTSNEIPIGDSRVVGNRKTGTDVFAGVIRDGGANPDQAVGFFAVIDDMATALETNNIANVKRSIVEINQIQQGVALALADVGSDLAVVESQDTVMDEQLLRLKSLRSDIEDTDYSEAVTRMQKELLGLQAAQSSFAQLSRLSLFNYIS